VSSPQIDNPARGFSHDNAGHVVRADYTATYNLAGQLATLTRNGVTTTYSYDTGGQRIRKSDGSAAGTLIFVHDHQGHLLGEYDASGAAVREYVWLGHIPVAIVMPSATAGEAPRIHFIHADHLDTPRLVVDLQGNTRWRWLAEPFGSTAPEVDPSGLGPFTFPLRFPGQYADAESGLFYNGQRYYDPQTGRYHQSDPIGLVGGINTYSYVDGQPTGQVDPDGLQGMPMPGVPIPLPPAAVPGTAENKVLAEATIRAIQAASEAVSNVYGRCAQALGRAWDRMFNENGADNVPPLPDVLVGDQGDPRAGPNKGGTKHTSGPLKPEYGGTGDFDADLQKLTGGARPWQPGDKAPPGSLIGANGIFGRPKNSSGGQSIDIPANGSRPHETLHYP
jgi:RHS repeat-associated protein